jgi:hypothetical protein
MKRPVVTSYQTGDFKTVSGRQHLHTPGRRRQASNQPTMAGCSIYRTVNHRGSTHLRPQDTIDTALRPAVSMLPIRPSCFCHNASSLLVHIRVCGTAASPFRPVCARMLPRGSGLCQDLLHLCGFPVHSTAPDLSSAIRYVCRTRRGCDCPTPVVTYIQHDCAALLCRSSIISLPAYFVTVVRRSNVPLARSSPQRPGDVYSAAWIRAP